MSITHPPSINSLKSGWWESSGQLTEMHVSGPQPWSHQPGFPMLVAPDNHLETPGQLHHHLESKSWELFFFFSKGTFLKWLPSEPRLRTSRVFIFLPCHLKGRWWEEKKGGKERGKEGMKEGKTNKNLKKAMGLLFLWNWVKHHIQLSMSSPIPKYFPFHWDVEPLCCSTFPESGQFSSHVLLVWLHLQSHHLCPRPAEAQAQSYPAWSPVLP